MNSKYVSYNFTQSKALDNLEHLLENLGLRSVKSSNYYFLKAAQAAINNFGKPDYVCMGADTHAKLYKSLSKKKV